MPESLSQRPELTDDEIQQAAALLDRLPRGFLPGPIFEAVTRLVTTPIVEVVPVRRSPEGKVQVLLTRRGPEDRWWPNMLHVPGGVVLATDSSTDNTEALERVLKGELAGVATGRPVFAFDIRHDSERGAEQSRVFWAEAQGESPAGEFYDADALPSDLVPSQLDFIPRAVQSYSDSSGQ